MELTNLYFTYNVQKNHFQNFTYSFETKYKDNVGDFLKLEKILDYTYPGPRFNKETEDEVNSYSLKSKLTYQDRLTPIFILIGEHSTVILEKDVSMSELDRTSNVELKISQYESNQRKTLNIYLKILKIQGLEISKRAKTQIDKIKYLRTGNFDQNFYLNL